MAKRIHKYRYINTRFWNDSYISELDPIEKLLFIYLLTNGHTNISGIYEIPLKIMAIETGIDESMFKKIFPRLKDKIRYIEGIVVIKNFIKHQETGSDTVQVGILNCLRDINLDFLKNVVSKGFYVMPPYYMDTLCIPYPQGGIYLDSYLDSDLDSDSDGGGKKRANSGLQNGNQIELPEWLNKPAWEEWLEYRKQSKKTVSAMSQKMQLKFLEENKADHIQVLKQSVMNGWTGLFEIKKGFNKNLANKGPVANEGKYENRSTKI